MEEEGEGEGGVSPFLFLRTALVKLEEEGGRGGRGESVLVFTDHAGQVGGGGEGEGGGVSSEGESTYREQGGMSTHNLANSLRSPSSKHGHL